MAENDVAKNGSIPVERGPARAALGSWWREMGREVGDGARLRSPLPAGSRTRLRPCFRGRFAPENRSAQERTPRAGGRLETTNKFKERMDEKR